MIKNIDDRTIISLIRKGDSSGYSLLYDTYAPLLYGIIYRIVRDEQAAENILEKTMLGIWKDLVSYDPEKQGFSTWIINLARRFARCESVQAKAGDIPASSCILELVMVKGLNIKQAANCLRISVSEALVKLREELKHATPRRN